VTCPLLVGQQAKGTQNLLYCLKNNNQEDINMKAKKRFLTIVLAIITMMACLAGCSKKGECEECGQYESLKKYVTDNGDERWYCDDCYRLAKVFL